MGIGEGDATKPRFVATAAVVIAGVVGPMLLVAVLVKALGLIRLGRRLLDGNVWEPVLAVVVSMAMVYTAYAPVTRLGRGHLGLLFLPWLLVHWIAGPALLIAGPVAVTRGEHLAFVAASALALGCLQFAGPSWGWMAAVAMR